MCDNTSHVLHRGPIRAIQIDALAFTHIRPTYSLAFERWRYLLRSQFYIIFQIIHGASKIR